MTNVQLFNFKSNQIRVVEIEGNPWFVAKDVCEVLGLTNPTIAVGPLDSSEKAKSGLGKGAPANVISESGLYKLDEVEKTYVARSDLGLTPASSVTTKSRSSARQALRGKTSQPCSLPLVVTWQPSSPSPIGGSQTTPLM